METRPRGHHPGSRHRCGRSRPVRRLGAILGGLLVTTAATLGSAGPGLGQEADHWPSLQGGPEHAGVVGARLPAPPLERVWRTSPQQGALSGAAVAPGIVVATARRRVVALDPSTGEALWTVPRNAGELIPPALAAEGRSQGVAVYVEGLAADSGLVAVDLEARERLWRVRMGNRSRSAPTIANGAVFVGSRDRHLYAVDLATGEVRWRARTDGAVDTSPAVSEGRVFVVAENGSSGMATLYGFDADSGRRAWPPFAAEGLSIGASSPAVGDGTVYVGFGDLQVRAFDAATGRLRWATGVGSDFSSMSAPALADGDLFIAARSGGLFRLDGRSGEPEWVFQFPSPVMWGSPLVVGESVFVGLQDGTLAAVEVGTGHRMWRRVLVGGAVGPLAPAGGMLLSSLLGRGGGMVALDHDPRGVTGDVPSPTELRPGLAVANFAAAFGAVLVGAMLLGRLAFRRAGQGAEAVGLRPTEPGGTE